MLAADWDTVRLFLHVLGATVWVGGQIILAALVPVLRRVEPSAPRAAARAFNRLGWGAFALLVATGVWNIIAVDDEPGSDAGSGSYQRTLAVKLAVVAVSGAAAFAHARARRPAALAVFGALSGLSAIAALFLGVLLAG